MKKFSIIILAIAFLLILLIIFFVQNNADDQDYGEDSSTTRSVNQLDVSDFTDDGASFIAQIANKIIEATR